jgi:replicative DNA helicase
MRLQNPAISRLEELIVQKDFPSTAYQAIRDVLDRTMGKPAESVAIEHSGEMVIHHELPQA